MEPLRESQQLISRVFVLFLIILCVGCDVDPGGACCLSSTQSSLPGYHWTRDLLGHPYLENILVSPEGEQVAWLISKSSCEAYYNGTVRFYSTCNEAKKPTEDLIRGKL